MTGNFSQQELEKFFEQLLLEMTPEKVLRIEQQLPETRVPLRRVVQNVNYQQDFQDFSMTVNNNNNNNLL